jgi:hypothetical protein
MLLAVFAALVVAMPVLGGMTSAQEADTTAPTLVDRSPKDRATGVSVGTNVTATFSEEMAPTTITRDTFRLLREVNGVFERVSAVAVRYDAATKTATLDPNSDLVANATYKAVITVGAKDLAGNAVVRPQVWYFTTADPTDTTPPTVIETVPYDGKTRVRRDIIPLAYFSEFSMNRASINTSTVRLHEGEYDPATSACEASCAIPAVVEYRRNFGKAVLNPNELLKAYTLYTVVVEGASGDTNGATLAVADEAGNPMTQTHSFTFTTGEGVGSNQGQNPSTT